MTSLTRTALEELEAAFEAFNAGDPERLIAAYDQDEVLLVGTDGHDWHDDPAAIATALRAEAGAVRADWDLRMLPAGDDRGVVAGTMRLVLADGTVIPVRATYAMRRRPEGWRIVHSHLSVARAPVA